MIGKPNQARRLDAEDQNSTSHKAFQSDFNNMHYMNQST